jgi:bifunctional non-homologous end joining protein LigD
MARQASLYRYKEKRHFDRTPEPAGRVERQHGHAYLIQKHAARRLHYDFRLELDGVLKSWAVTKGPSLDPAVRRLAVHVEDHPLAYGNFEGVIPQGQYGGGTVMLWDRGSWEPLGDVRKDYAAGKLKFVLHGERLHGGWTLVRMHGRPGERGDNWLLIKERDEFAVPGDADALLDDAATSVASGHSMQEIADPKQAEVWNSKRADGKAESKAKSKRRAVTVGKVAGAKAASLPKFVEPELATLVQRPPDGDGWLHEIKIDGYRVFCRRDGDKVTLLTRTGQDWTHKFAAVAEAVRGLPARQFAIDGEIAVLNDHGQSSFGDLQDALSDGRDEKLSLVAFDLLYLDGKDLRAAPLLERKKLLRKLLPAGAETAVLRYSDHAEGSGEALFAEANKRHLEGIVSKRVAAPYRSGRVGDWLKAKCVARQEFVIGGFTEGQNARKGAIGALLIGYYQDGELRYAGHVGTGFTAKLARELRERLKRIESKKSPFASVPAEAKRGAIWVRPDLVGEVEYSNWTSDGVLRHPSFQGLREDKGPKSITREQAVPAAAAKKSSNAKSAHSVAGVTISHPDRIVFPDSGATKLDLARYYESVGDFILPEIKNRPLSLLRCPQGLAGDCFFQKHFTTGVKELRRIAIKESTATREYVLVRDVKDLVSLAQEGVVEIHPWGAHANDVDKPDRIIFDLDPAPDVAFAKVIEAARLVRKMLEGVKTNPFVKTTGGKGLHVVVPLRPTADWTSVKEFAHAVALTLVESRPDDFVANMKKSERTGKIFVDYLRNDRGSTGVAAYSVRARAGAPVAMPVAWQDLSPKFRPDRFTLQTVPKLLAARRVDPWADVNAAKSAATLPRHAPGAKG